MQNIALITVTGVGLGLSLAKLLIKKNWLVYGFSRTNKIYHENFNFNKIDLSDSQKVSRLSLPKIDSNYNVFLINNAATIGEIVPLKKRKEKCILDSYNLNIITPTVLCKKFLISYEKNFKTIINISSGAAIKNISSWSTYCASKSAIDMLSKVLHEENYKNLSLQVVILWNMEHKSVDTGMFLHERIRNCEYYLTDNIFFIKLLGNLPINNLPSLNNLPKFFIRLV